MGRRPLLSGLKKLLSSKFAASDNNNWFVGSYPRSIHQADYKLVFRIIHNFTHFSDIFFAKDRLYRILSFLESYGSKPPFKNLIVIKIDSVVSKIYVRARCS